MRLLLSQAFALVLLAASAGAAQHVATAGYQQPVVITDGWKTASAEALGVDSRRLAALTQTLRAWPELGVHAVLIERAGRLI